MSRHSTIKISTLALLFLAFAAAHFSQRENWLGGDQSAAYKKIKRTAKMKAPLEIKIEKQDQKKVLINDTVTLVATLRPTSSVGRVRWEWQSTPGVELLDSTAGHINTLHTGEEHTLQLRFKQLSEKNELIHLRVYNDDGRSQLVGAFSYNSLEQDNIDIETVEMLERQRIYHEEMGIEGTTVLSSESPNEHSH